MKLDMGSKNIIMPDLSFSLDLGMIELEDEIQTLDPETLYDLLIIGAGPAGINAALYAKRKCLSVGIVARSIGGQVKDTTVVENYLGYKSISGSGLISKFHEHLKSFEISLEKDRTVLKIEKKAGLFYLHIDNKKLIKSRSVLIATGAKPRKLGIPGEERLTHQGVTYCGICDGPLFKGRDVIIVGGGDSAVEATIDLARHAKKIYLVHRSNFRADEILLKRLPQLENLEIKQGHVVDEIIGADQVEAAIVRNLESGQTEKLPVGGVLIEIGRTPNSDPFLDLVDSNKWREIIVDERQATNVSGIFAAGDVTSEPVKQIIVAAAAGARAAIAINEYLHRN